MSFTRVTAADDPPACTRKNRAEAAIKHAHHLTPAPPGSGWITRDTAPEHSGPSVLNRTDRPWARRYRRSEEREDARTRYPRGAVGMSAPGSTGAPFRLGA